jgi:hypothetical protein
MVSAAIHVIRCVALTALACGAAAGALAREPVTAAKAERAKATVPRLSAEEIVAKNAAARGGLDAWRKVQTMVWTGHIESPHAPVPVVQFMLAQERPNKTRFEVNAMGDRSLRVFNGAQGWKLRATHGRPDVRPYGPEEVRFEAGGPGIDGALIDYAAKGRSVEVAGVDEVENTRAYHLIVRTGSGEAQQVWVDAQTFLEVRYDRPVPSAADASRTVSVVYRDYKTFEGLKIPSVIETGGKAGNMPDRMVIDSVTLNPQLDAQTFAEPGARSGRGLRMPGGRGAIPTRDPSASRRLPAGMTPVTPGIPAPSVPSAVPEPSSPPPSPPPDSSDGPTPPR